MKTSELIIKLQESLQQNGDLEVCWHDDDMVVFRAVDTIYIEKSHAHQRSYLPETILRLDECAS